MNESANDMHVSFPFVPCRLDKYLRVAAGLSRTRAAQAWHDGRISAPGAEHIASFVFEEDDVTLDGVVVKPVPASHYFLLNKPKGFVTAVRDERKPCLAQWIPNDRTFPVGRLDKDTTGVLFLTDDGDLANLLLHPRFHIPKRYRLTLGNDVGPEIVDKLTAGVELHDGPARALEAYWHHERDLSLVIDEGRNRIVRRMAKAVGIYLEHLHREAMGALTLGDLEQGEMRAMTPTEAEAIWTAVGGRAQVFQMRVAALRRRVERLKQTDRPYDRLEAWLSDLDEGRR